MPTTRRQAREQAIQDRNSRSRLRIDALPSELISLIFLFRAQCIGPLIYGRYDPGAARNYIMIQLRLVCSRWNAVATTTPSLWTTICVDILGWPMPAKILSLWLDRSGHLPLDLHIRFYHQLGDTFIGPIPEILHVLGNSISHWQSLSLNVNPSAVHLFYHLPLSDAILLKSLRFDVWRLPEAFFAHIGTLPNLRAFHPCPLGKVPPRAITHSMQQLLGNLTYLYLVERLIKWTSISQICQQCRPSISVIDLDLHSNHRNDQSFNKPHSPSPIAFPNLTILKARIANMHNFTTLQPLFSFHASQLQVLDICVDIDMSSHFTGFCFVEELSKYLSEVRCTLQILSIRYIFQTHVVEDILRIPSVASISLVKLGWKCRNDRIVTACVNDQSRELGRAVTVLRALGMLSNYPTFFVGWNDASKSLSEYRGDHTPLRSFGLIEHTY